MAEIDIQNVSKMFGEVCAVDNLSLKLKSGEFIVLLGPSGCGKTTLLRIIAGLTEPTTGEVMMDGKPITHLPPGQRNLAMVFQNYALFPHMSVERNLSFGMRLRREKMAQINRRVQEVAELLRIGNLLHRYPRELSGGEKQRVALGRALIRQPKAFLLDEPLSNLDPALRVTMRAELRQLHQRLHITTIYVTHDQVEAMTMGDRIAVLNEGKLMQVGEPSELYSKPANLFTATFIGSPSMNTIPATVEASESKLILRAQFLEWKIKLPDKLSLRDIPREVVIGIRPEHIDIVDEKAENALSCEVVLVEELGREEILHLERHGLSLRLVTSAKRRFSAGENIFVAPRAGFIHLFDARTKERLTEEPL